MRLLKLSANKPTFHEISFRRRGLSIVVAEQHKDTTSNTDTYNGVGKSLMLAIIDYCLGSQRNKAFAKHLKGWVFSLEIELAGQVHVISRSAENSSSIKLDDRDIKLKELTDFLRAGSFSVPSSNSTLSFRSLLPRFMRSPRKGYHDFKIAYKGDEIKPYSPMLRIAYLLGLDLKLARAKHDLRTREESLRKTMAQLKKEPAFAQLLSDDKVDIELTTLQEESQQLKADLESFKVAEDYRDIELEADEIKRALGKMRRDSSKLREAIAQIDRSLISKSDLQADRVVQMYEEIRVTLPDQVRRRIEEVVRFQDELKRKRVFRLTLERQRLQEALSVVEGEVASLSGSLDERLRYLGDHRALDEFLAVSARVSDLEQQLVKLNESKTIRDRVDKELKVIQRDQAQGNVETDEYLDAAKPLTDEASSLFRKFVFQLYGQRRSGLNITNNSKLDNQTRYDIDAHIGSGAAEGINEARIFCFDMTLLALGRGHSMRFVAHDSTLFGAIDPRQRWALFKIADRVCEENDLQYIATLNLHDITSIRKQVNVSEDEVDSLIGGSAVVARLTDQSPKTKLLGVQIHELDYTK